MAPFDTAYDFLLAFYTILSCIISEINGNGNENISNVPPTVDRRRIT